MPIPFVDRGLLARWFIDEAASGTGPTALIDSAPSPLSLLNGYFGNVAYGSDAGGNLGLQWSAAAGPGGAGAPVSGTKLEAIDGVSQLTYEVVAEVAETGAESVLLHLGDTTDDVSLICSSTEIIIRYDDGSRTLRWAAPLAGRQVIHGVYDSSENNGIDRFRVYVDGTLIENPTGQRPPQGGSLTVGNTAAIAIGNDDGNDQSIAGQIGYVAIYAAALSAAEIANNVTRLNASDDR